MNKERLYNACYDMHYNIARKRQCTSTAVFLEAYRTNGKSFRQAIVAAMMTLGGIHAPIKQCRTYLTSIMNGTPVPVRNIPGWGSDFVKGKPDPMLSKAALAIGEECQAIHDIIIMITTALHQRGKKVYPNAGCYTAAISLALDYPEQTCEYLMLGPRISAWEEMARGIEAVEIAKMSQGGKDN